MPTERCKFVRAKLRESFCPAAASHSRDRPQPRPATPDWCLANSSNKFTPLCTLSATKPRTSNGKPVYICKILSTLSEPRTSEKCLQNLLLNLPPHVVVIRSQLILTLTLCEQAGPGRRRIDGRRLQRGRQRPLHHRRRGHFLRRQGWLLLRFRHVITQSSPEIGMISDL